MTFRDTSTGWIGGDVPSEGVYIYKTSNSGVTWSKQPLTLPAGYEHAVTTTTAPIFFGSNDCDPAGLDEHWSRYEKFVYLCHS